MKWISHLSLVVVLFSSSLLAAADVRDAEQQFRQGEYRQALAAAKAEVDRGVWNERWPRLLIQCQLLLGQYPQARATYEAALQRYSSSIPLRQLGGDVYRFNNDPVRGERELEAILEIVRRSPWRYSDKENLIAIGRYFLHRGEDAKKVLELFYDRVRNTDANFVDAYVASGELALDKHDYAMAAKDLDRAAKMKPDDPQIAFLQFEAWQSSDSQRAQAMRARALSLNPNHLPSLLSLADDAIDAEQFEQAEEILQTILRINPYQPQAWAYHAVIAHLQGHFEAERLLRKAALCRWESNPEVDHLIGNKLSRHYRFTEGAEYQQRSLKKKPDFVEAKFQLAQDLLRIGQDEAGWKMADEVFQQDGYNVVAHNLVNLHDVLRKFTTLEAEGFQIRMDAREARIYGDDVIDLLAEARRTLTEKYAVELDEPTIIEIFPQQKDFAIRTFGVPGGAGFLGVCFGRLITANSPASQTQTPANWQAVLWHEFCHVVTLQKTKNRMPRWLSEGISVYEELQRDGRWGQSMTPTYREMILGDAFTPMSDLSSAFMQPKSAMHLQFAYYESSLAVRYIVEQHGFDTLKKILSDLAIGLSINDALTRSIGSLEVIDQQFADFSKSLANDYGKPEAWKRETPEADELDPNDPFSGLVDEPSPTRFEILLKQAAAQVAAKKWSEALDTIAETRELFEEPDVPIAVLSLEAEVYRQQQATDQELQVLTSIANRSSDSVASYRRLIELTEQQQDWEAVARYADQLAAVNPLTAEVQEQIAHAAEQTGTYQRSVRALQALTEMEPIDPAGLRFRLAKSLAEVGETSDARRQLLIALEQAPRFRDAHRLLLRLNQPPASEPSPAAVEPKTDEPTESEAKAEKRSDPDPSAEPDPPVKPDEPAANDDPAEADAQADVDTQQEKAP
ncbi:tetratricopeptide repeat protein [Rosistilla oblonga]|uniref:Peptidase MA-like domain-containing protein n=1 Tax=Rosistilla oblonga TaxID=2527990 RepID=A0A518INH7_9BACT|nr:tetratricopeptide repeat protein [Rosistilla oblonga]QDV54641.1 hypothetical protein Mal33_05960 [Rosistilla oblonga]